MPAFSRGEQANFYILTLSLISVQVTFSTIFMMLPLFFRSSGMSVTETGILIASGTIAGMISSFIFGKVSDHVGRKPVLLFAIFGYSSCFLLFYFFTGFWIFLATRFLEGFTGYVILPTSYTMVADMFPEKVRGKAMGLLEGLMTIGRIMGPLIVAYVVPLGAYSLYFLVSTAFVVPGGIINLLLLQETRPETAILHGSRLSLTLPHLHPSSFRLSLRRVGGPALMFYLANIVRAFGQQLRQPIFSLFLSEALGLGLTEISIFFSLRAVIIVIFSPFFGRLSDRYGRKPMIVGGTLCLAISDILYTTTRSFSEVLGFRSLNSLGTSMVQATGVALMADLLPASERGFGMGIYNSLTTETATLGAIFSGYLTENLGFNSLFYTSSVASTIGALMISALVPEPRKTRKTSEAA